MIILEQGKNAERFNQDGAEHPEPETYKRKHEVFSTKVAGRNGE